MISEDDVLGFAAALFKSVWALELLLVLHRGHERAWSADELIKELRSSRVVIAEALNNLVAAGLVVEDETGRYRYHAAGPATDEMIVELEKLYVTKPTVIAREIVSTPNMKLKLLSDAFRIKK
jgi:predicted transcriptional regulator